VLEHITPVLLTLNEAANISRTLESLSWARDIVVVDSGSRDGTRRIVKSYSNTRLFQRDFDTHARQWNFAIHETGVSTQWILALDADHAPTDALLAELTALSPTPDVYGYRIGFIYCVGGRPLHGSLYPPLVSLYRRGRGCYVQQGHTQRLRIQGRVERLRGRIRHDDRKSLSAWFSAQLRYARLEAELIRTTPWRHLSASNRLRRLIVPAPLAALLWSLLLKGTLFDGPAGVWYSAQRLTAECLLSVQLLLPRAGDPVVDRPADDAVTFESGMPPYTRPDSGAPC